MRTAQSAPCLELVRKPEVQPLAPLVLRRSKILVLFVLAHGPPDVVAPLVPPHVVALDQNGSHGVPGNDPQDCPVSSAVDWGVVFSVDVGGDDAAGLDGPVTDSVILCFLTQR